MKKLTESQKSKRAAKIIRWNDAKDGLIPESASAIQTIIMDANGLNTERRHSTGVKLVFDYLNTICSFNMNETNDSEISNILNAAYKGHLTETEASKLAAFAIENEIEF